METMVLNFFGKLSNGGQVMGIELPPKRMKNFKPFSLEKYRKVVDKVSKDFPDLNFAQRVNKIDKLLFENENE